MSTNAGNNEEPYVRDSSSMYSMLVHLWFCSF